MEDIKTLCTNWITAKEQEREFSAFRRELEDQLIQRLKIENLDKSQTKEIDGFKINATGRVIKKVDAQHVRELAAQHDLTKHLMQLFSWDAKINMREWKKTDPQIIEILEQAINETLSRPTFKIEEL